MPKSPDAFRTISEVSEWLETPAHVLRFWESKFTQVKPVKRAGGRRYYRPGDMELLGGIKKLLHDDGMTIKGVQKVLREQGVRHVAAMSPLVDGEEDRIPGEGLDDFIADAPFTEAEETSGEVVAFRQPAQADDVEDATVLPDPDDGDDDDRVDDGALAPGAAFDDALLDDDAPLDAPEPQPALSEEPLSDEPLSNEAEPDIAPLPPIDPVYSDESVHVQDDVAATAVGAADVELDDPDATFAPTHRDDAPVDTQEAQDMPPAAAPFDPNQGVFAFDHSEGLMADADEVIEHDMPEMGADRDHGTESGMESGWDIGSDSGMDSGSNSGTASGMEPLDLLAEAEDSLPPLPDMHDPDDRPAQNVLAETDEGDATDTQTDSDTQTDTLDAPPAIAQIKDAGFAPADFTDQDDEYVEDADPTRSADGQSDESQSADSQSADSLADHSEAADDAAFGTLDDAIDDGGHDDTAEIPDQSSADTLDEIPAEIATSAGAPPPQRAKSQGLALPDFARAEDAGPDYTPPGLLAHAMRVARLDPETASRIADQLPALRARLKRLSDDPR